jgi:hypothetical protein
VKLLAQFQFWIRHQMPARWRRKRNCLIHTF